MGISAGLGRDALLPGLVLVSSSSFTAQTGVDIDSCFSSQYANYRVVIDLSAISANDTVVFVFRDSSGNITSSNYDYTMLEWYSGSVAATSSLAVGNSRIQFTYTTPGYMAATIDIYNPQVALRTQWTSNATSMNGTTWTLADRIDGNFRLTTQFTGFRLTTAGGTATMTGTIRVYGYRN